jgi:hypothetical protein
MEKALPERIDRATTNRHVSKPKRALVAIVDRKCVG